MSHKKFNNLRTILNYSFMKKNTDILYILILIIIRFLFSIPSTIKSIIALPLIIIIPIRIGFFMFNCLKLYSLNKIISSVRFILYWSLGIIFILFISSLMSLFNYFYLDFLILILLSIMIISSYSNYLEIIKHSENREVFSKLNMIIFLIFINGFIVSIIYRSFSPFPLQPSWDAFTENTVFNKIYYNNFYHLLRTTYSSAILVNAKTPLLPLLASIICKIVNIDYISLCWSLPFLSIPLYSLSIFLLSYKYLGNKYIAFIASIISIWIGEFGLPTFSSPSQSGLTVIFLSLFLYSILYLSSHSSIEFKNKVIYYSILFLCFFSFHYLISLYTFSLLILLYFLKKISERWKFTIYFLSIFSLGIIALIIMQHLEILSLEKLRLDLLNYIFDIETRYYPFSYKFDMIDTWYTRYIFYTALLSSIYIIMKRFIYNLNEELNMLWVAYLFLMTVGIFFSPINYAMRLYPLMHPLLSFLSAYFFFIPITEKIITINKKIMMIGVLFLFLSPIILLPLTEYVNKHRFMGDTNGIATSFMNYEISMASWIRENTPSDSVIISEPVTQNIFEALANRQSLGGMFVEIDKINEIKNALLLDEDTISTYTLRNISNNKKGTVILIISGRVLYWINSKLDKIFHPHDIKPQYMEYIRKMNNSHNFNLLHQVSNQIFAFELGLVENLSFEDLLVPNLKNISNWIPGNYLISLDMNESIESESSIKIEGKNLCDWEPVGYEFSYPIDISRYLYLSIWIKIDANFSVEKRNDFFIGLRDNEKNQSWWYNTKSFTLHNGEWEKVILKVNLPDSVSRVNLKEIKRIRFSSKRYNQDLIIYIDNIKLSSNVS